MEEWKTIHISDIGKIVTGKTPRTSIAENYGGRIPFLTPSDDLSGKYAPRSAKTLTNLGLAEVKNCLLPDHAICVSCIGSDLGKVVMTKQPTVTNQQFNSIIPNADFDPDFVYYLMTIVGKKLNYLSKTSTAVPIVNKSSFSAFEVSVPPLHEQKRIARILSSIDDIIALNNRINHNLEEQALALFKSWFIDFEPFKDGNFVDSELGLIPEGWQIKRAEDLCQINIGKTPPRKETQWFSLENDESVWISISDMADCGVFIHDSAEKLTKEALKKFNIILVPEGSVLLSFKLTIGRVAIANRELTTNEAIARFVTNDNVLALFLYLVLNKYDYSKLGSTSSIATAVNSKIVKSMPILWPGYSIISAFSDSISAAFREIKKRQEENRCLTSLRESLLPELMSGRMIN